jgi:hypothetical protein
VGQDHPFVLTGQWVGEVKQALKLVVELLSLAGEEVMHELVGANALRKRLWDLEGTAMDIRRYQQGPLFCSQQSPGCQ